MKKVSIVIPVYNAEKTVCRCIESIENGTYKNIEIILVNDCSKDDSMRICEQLNIRYTNIKVIQNEKNRGVSFTRNAGIAQATGEYIVFVDSDDWVSNDYIEVLVDGLEKNNTRFAVSGYVNHDEIVNNRTDYFGWDSFEKIKTVRLADVLLELFHNRLLQQLWNKIFITDFIKTYHIKFDEKISMGEDFRFILDYLKVANITEITLINQYLYHYIRDNTGSLMSKFEEKDVYESIKNISSMMELFNDKEIDIQNIFEIEVLNVLKQYSYKIMHNPKLSIVQKRKKILALSSKDGHRLFTSNLKLYIKERIAIGINKVYRRK